MTSPTLTPLTLDALLASMGSDINRQALNDFWGSEPSNAQEPYDADKAEECHQYQTEQASTLVQRDASWREIDCSFHASEPSNQIGEEMFLDADDECWDKEPDIHQFYIDLFGAALNFFPEWIPVDDDENGCDTESAEFIADYLDIDPDGDPFDGVLVNHRDRSDPFRCYTDYRSFLNGLLAETSFIYMGRFWQPRGKKYLIAKRNAMITLGGFCVDIDRYEDAKGNYFDASYVMNTLVDVFRDYPAIEPNYLMLTGTGIQLWYVFGRQIPLLSKKSPRKKKFERVLKSLYTWFDANLPSNRFKVDVPCATICHAFRAPGSPSKNNYPTRLFVKNGRRRQKISPLSLSDFLGCDLEPYDVEKWDQAAYEESRHGGENVDWDSLSATDKQLAYLEKLRSWGFLETVDENVTKAGADRLIKEAEITATRRKLFKANADRIILANGVSVPHVQRSPRLYEYTRDRILRDTDAGSRYNALFGLAGVAWNCCIPKSRVERDMLDMLDTEWAHRKGHDRKSLSKRDVKNALLGYSPLGALRTREALEARLTWSYAPPAPRNHRDRKTHLHGRWFIEKSGIQTEMPNKCKMMREATHSMNNKSRSVQRLAHWLESNPKGSKRAACEALHMSRQTVTKYWKEACAKAGVEDTRSGNHNPY